MKPAAAFLLLTPAFAQSWVLQNSGVKASLRGISAVNSSVAWASGTGGTWLRTLDAGAHWTAGVVAGAADLDFRGIRAFDANTAMLLSSGTGDKSRIYKTTDGGSHWTLLFTNPDAKGFFDAIAFWDPMRGIVLGDAVGGAMTVFTSTDGGAHWAKQKTPEALPNEGAFAASNSSLALFGRQDAWFGTGGAAAARIYHSGDGGRNWTVKSAPVRSDGASAGIFSIAFRDAKHGIAVGGDYRSDKEPAGNAAITNDGGASWRAPASSGPHGFRSSVHYLPRGRQWIATGTSGSDVSKDDGQTWTQFDNGSFNALSGAWAVGANGRIAVLNSNGARSQ